MKCPICDAVRPGIRPLYWHLRIDHLLDHDSAFAAAGDAAETVHDAWPENGGWSQHLPPRKDRA